MKAVRCAIYTRKSSEEGLEQDFNSLDAQAEACAAYIKSQASEGWNAIRDRYDDGGISGGTLQRPGLQRLLADIGAAKIDIVVVYKVDRLTRSLLDFARLVEKFDKAGTSFVSVTQSFNTTTSMGRLTLNMLLSFAQFEREVTAERIRDKIAASKARGMWMGGTPPIGYRPDGRSLAIVEEHAAIVRHIFDSYLALGKVSQVCAELERNDVRSPERATAKGRPFGGRPFSRGQIYRMLSNVIYSGRIEHNGTSYKGSHSRIIDPGLWDAVQNHLAANLNGHRSGIRVSHESLLAGRLVDDRGVPMVASHACRGKVRYRYYVSRDLQASPNAQTVDGWRLPAREIEPLVRAQVAKMLSDPLQLLASMGEPVPDADTVRSLIARGRALAEEIVAARSLKGDRLVRTLVATVCLTSDHVTLSFDSQQLLKLFGLIPSLDTNAIQLTVATSLRRSGHAMRLLLENGAPATASIDRTLVQLIRRGREWWQQLLDDPSLTLAAIGRREGMTGGYVLRLVRLAFLDPEIAAAIIDGTAPAPITIDRLTAPGAIAVCWNDQRRSMGLPQRH